MKTWQPRDASYPSRPGVFHLYSSITSPWRTRPCDNCGSDGLPFDLFTGAVIDEGCEPCPLPPFKLVL